MRGRKPLENPRNVTITVPVTVEQKARLRYLAESRKVTVGSLIRSIVFDKQDELVAA